MVIEDSSVGYIALSGKEKVSYSPDIQTSSNDEYLVFKFSIPPRN